MNELLFSGTFWDTGLTLDTGSIARDFDGGGRGSGRELVQVYAFHRGVQKILQKGARETPGNAT